MTRGFSFLLGVVVVIVVQEMKLLKLPATDFHLDNVWPELLAWLPGSWDTFKNPADCLVLFPACHRDLITWKDSESRALLARIVWILPAM